MRPNTEVMAKDKEKVRVGLKKLDLQAYYAAVNERYFGGKLPKDVTVVWKTQKQLERIKGVHHVYGFAGFINGWRQRVVLNIDAHVAEPRQLLNTIVHEAIHILMPLGDRLNRKSSYADTTNTAHGEFFGTECRRINNLVGYKLMSDRECSYGTAGRKWAIDNVIVECDEYWAEGVRCFDNHANCGLRLTKRQMRKHKAEHERHYNAWYEEFGEAHEAWNDFWLDSKPALDTSDDDVFEMFLKAHPKYKKLVKEGKL